MENIAARLGGNKHNKYTVYREIFVLENFRVLNFRVKIFSWVTHKIFLTSEDGYLRAAVVRERLP